LVERFFGCYTPGSLVCGLAASIGFEKIFAWHDNGPTTWMEFKKPGVMVSLKGGQMTAEIVPYPVAKSK
jgi:hypothetical protein